MLWKKGMLCACGGFQDLVLNKLDALLQGDDWQGRLRICTAYADPKGGTVYHVLTMTPIAAHSNPFMKSPAGARTSQGIRQFMTCLRRQSPMLQPF